MARKTKHDACHNCGACEKCEPCDHCHCCRKCGKVIALPSQPWVINIPPQLPFTPVPLTPYVPPTWPNIVVTQGNKITLDGTAGMPPTTLTGMAHNLLS